MVIVVPVSLITGAGLVQVPLIIAILLFVSFFSYGAISGLITKHDPPWLIYLVGHLVPRCMPVMMRDFQNDIYHSVAWLDDDGVWRCPIFYGTGVGSVSLNSNGSTMGDAGSGSYVYFWQPLRPSDRMQFFLYNSELVDWDNVHNLDRKEVRDLVSRLRTAAKQTQRN